MNATIAAAVGTLPASALEVVRAEAALVTLGRCTSRTEAKALEEEAAAEAGAVCVAAAPPTFPRHRGKEIPGPPCVSSALLRSPVHLMMTTLPTYWPT